MRFILAVIVCSLLAIVAIVIIEPPRGVEQRAEEIRLRNRLELLRAENEQLNREIQRLRNEIFYMEKYLRDVHGLARTNELIYKFDY